LARLAKRDRPTAARIVASLRALAGTGDPRARGKALTGNLAGLWRYRVGDWRVVADIQDQALVVLAIDISHRSSVYTKPNRHV
jgi:mRNA interferase RelE/StbE